MAEGLAGVKLIRTLIYVLGVLTLLWIFSTQFQLRNPHQPGIINPSKLVPPKVSVRR